jgi:hypothetical protein
MYELGIFGKNSSCSNLRRYLSVCLKGPRKIRKNPSRRDAFRSQIWTWEVWNEKVVSPAVRTRSLQLLRYVRLTSRVLSYVTMYLLMRDKVCDNVHLSSHLCRVHHRGPGSDPVQSQRLVFLFIEIPICVISSNQSIFALTVVSCTTHQETNAIVLHKDWFQAKVYISYLSWPHSQLKSSWKRKNHTPPSSCGSTI